MTKDPAAESPMLAQLGWVQRLATSLARDPDVGADLAQDAACEWLARAPRWARRDSGLRAWLARTIRSRSVDHARSERARRARETAARLPATDEAADAVLERLERQRRVAAAVHGLPEPYRCTILYRYLDELPLRAVAQRTGVPEATARKRIERGLELLRTRLDPEFGTDARTWALGLLAPASRWRVEPSPVGAVAGTLAQGVWLMAGKKLMVLGAALVAISMGWLLLDRQPANVEVGGRGVVVPASVAAARTAASPTMTAATTTSEAVDRTPVAPTPAASTPSIRGFLFVDEEHRAPAQLTIVAERQGQPGRQDAAVQVDPIAATWSLALDQDEAVTLWVTSSATVPAQIPVPVALLGSGGTFDLHLTSGRTLALRFVDAATGAPLANLEFEFEKAIELHRGGGRVTSRGAMERHRADTLGQALVTGVPEAGHVGVTTDLQRRERAMLMRDGRSFRSLMHGERIWSLNLTPAMPRQLEATIATVTPSGEATATGQVPAWAVATAAAGALDGVRIVARKWADAARDRGDPFVLTADAQGHFELQAQAPSHYRVWLERAPGREPLSTPSLVEFTHAGAHAPIVFTPLHLATVQLHCRNVPTTGRLEVLVAAEDGQPRFQSVACAGEALSFEVAAAAGDRLRLTLRAGQDPGGKSSRQWEIVVADARRQLDIDLAGSWRRVEIMSDVIPFRGEGAVSLLPCRHGAATLDERIVVLCTDGLAATTVHVAAGRWLYAYSDGGPHPIWGVVDVAGDTENGAVLALRPRLHLVPSSELQPGCRFDAIEGVSLQALPEQLRHWQPRASDDQVAFPLDAVHVRTAARR